MKIAIHWCRRTAALVVGVLAIGSVAAQSPPAAKAATASQAAKPANRTVAPAPRLVLEPRAMELLKAMSTRLAAAKSMSFTATVNYEYPSQLGPPIAYTMRYDVTMLRPDKLKVVMPGDGPASEFYYDGKTMTAYAPAENLVAVADAPASIDATLKKAYDTAAIYYPFTDLLATDPYAALADGAMLAFYVGPASVVGGTKTDMVVWANDDVFLQIWIGVDDKLPRRLRAIFRTDPLELRHEMELSNWQLDGSIAQDAFASQKAQAAKRIAFASPVAAPSPGVKPMAKAKPANAALPGNQPKSQ